MRESSLTPKTLSRWLRNSGALPDGTVTDVHFELEFETSISKLVFLTATYSPDAPPDLPRRLLVKSPLSPAPLNEGSSELQFYRRLAPNLGTPPTARCLATIDDDRDTDTLVLEDLRATHDNPRWPLPPSKKQCERALDALVRAHAQWWEAPTLGHSIGKFPTTESLMSMVQGISAHLPAFFDTVGDALPAKARSVYERVFGSSLKPWMRLIDRRGLTSIHGDAHTWNFLFPRSGDGPAFLLDWQLWHVDIGARDLAYFMALHWYPSRRREVERPLLRYYHEGLLTQGREDYPFDELWLDYRRCAVRNLTIPIITWSRGMKPELWWHILECALAAYSDLECDDLL